MKIIDPAIFCKMHETIRKCEFPDVAVQSFLGGNHCRGPLEVAHLQRRSQGRIDFLSVMLCRRHHAIYDGTDRSDDRPNEADVLVMLSRRFQCWPDDVLAALQWINAAPKKFRTAPEIWADEFEAEMQGLPAGAARLCREALGVRS